MKAPMSLMPAVPLAVGFMCGIVLARYTACSLWIPVVGVLAGCAMYRARLHVVAFMFMSVAVGWINVLVRSEKSPALLPSCDEYVVRGIIEEVRDQEASVAFVMQVESMIPISGGIADNVAIPFRMSGTIGGFSVICHPADTLVLRAGIIPLPRPDYIPGISDYESYLMRCGIFARATAVVVDSVIPGVGAGVPLRERLSSELAGTALSEESVSIVSALVLGVGDMLTPEMRMSFRDSGLAHVFALSGLHVGIILLIVAVFLLPWRITGHQKSYILFMLVLLWGYAAFTGMSVSVLRASVMASVLLCARMLGRRYSSVNALAVAAVIILAIKPEELFGPGFQLSFAAVVSMLIFARSFSIFGRSRRFAGLGRAIGASLAATTGTFAIVAYWFGGVPVYVFLANMAMLWFMPVVVGSAFVYCVFVAVGMEILWLAEVVDFLCRSLNSISGFIAGLPGARIYLSCSGSLWFVVAYFVAVGIFALAWRQNKRWLSLCVVLVGISVIVATESLAQASAGSEAYVIDDSGTPHMLVREGRSCVLISDMDMSSDEAGRKYASYVHSVGADSLAVLRTNGADIGGRKVFMADAVRSLQQGKYDYVLVGNAYGASPHYVIDSLRPDTVVLGSGMSSEMRRRWYTDCASAGVAVVDLRTEGVHFIF